MRFDWRKFCESNGIEFREFGHTTTVAKDNINIRCPFCTGTDGKFHMGLHLKTGKFGCWKSTRHAGHSPEWLICKLLHCSLDEARKHVSEQDWTSGSFGELRDALGRLDRKERADTRLSPYDLPRELFRLHEHERQSAPFFEYLRKRRLPAEVAEFYKLYGAHSGEFRWRIVLPFFTKGLIVGATGRHIGRSSKRYHTRPDDVTDKILFNFDRAARVRGELLVLVEGPFDALVLDWLFEESGLPAAAVALLGLHFGSSKRQAVHELAGGFECVSVLLDRGAESRAMEMADELKVTGVRARMDHVPWNVKDPGEFRAEHAAGLLRSKK